MMELKVQCDCGQKYKFDVEPVNNQMPFRVNCPICGAEGTAKANALLQAQAPALAAPVPMAAMAAPVAAAAPVAMAAPPPPPAGAPKLRIGGSAPAAAVADAPPPPPMAPIPPARPGVFPGRPGAFAAAPGGKPKRKPNFAMGMLGGFLGALVGGIIYYFVNRLIGWEFGFVGIVAIPVGFLAGLGARLLGGEQDGHELGYITAALAVAGILGGEYFAARSLWHKILTDNPSSGYEAKVAEAKKIIAAVPNGTEAEIRIYLAKEDADDDEKPDTNAVPADMVKEFQSTLPEMRDLASGKTSKEDYEKQHAAEIAKEQEAEKSVESTFNAVFVLLLLNKVTLVSTCAAASLAYKMSS